MTADNLLKLKEIKDDIRDALDEVFGEDPGNAFAGYADMIRHCEPKEDWYSLILEPAGGEVRWKEFAPAGLQSEYNLSQASYFADTDYVTGTRVRDVDFSKATGAVGGSYALNSLAPVYDATRVAYADMERLTDGWTRSFSWRFLSGAESVGKITMGTPKTNVDYCFADFPAPEFPDGELNMKGVWTANYMFARANLRRLPRFKDAGSVYNVSYLFKECSFETAPDLSPLSALTGVTFCSHMFNYCGSMKSVDLSPLAAWTGVTVCGSMFSECRALESADLSPLAGWTGVTSCTFFFENCRAMKSVTTLPPWTGLTNCAGFFSNCFELGSVDLTPWKGCRLSSATSFFNNCWELARLDVDGLDLTGTDLTSAFYGCSSLTTVTGTLRGTVTFPVDLSACPLTAESAMVFVEALDPDAPGVLKVSQTTLEALSEEQLAQAASKGWTVAG